MSLTKKEMPETMYKASRYCRILGNPTAYLILKCLNKSRLSPTELSESLEIPIYTISNTLRHLRHIDLVRYETIGIKKIYWVKEKAILKILESLENIADSERKRTE